MKNKSTVVLLIVIAITGLGMEGEKIFEDGKVKFPVLSHCDVVSDESGHQYILAKDGIFRISIQFLRKMHKKTAFQTVEEYSIRDEEPIRDDDIIEWSSSPVTIGQYHGYRTKTSYLILNRKVETILYFLDIDGVPVEFQIIGTSDPSVNEEALKHIISGFKILVKP